MDAGALRIAVLKETQPGERRVALVPDVAGRLVKGGLAVVVESGAGAAALFPDADYRLAGASLESDAAGALAGARVVAKVRPPTLEEAVRLPEAAVLISHLSPAREREVLRALAARGVRTLSMDLVPRSTRAQSMDALSSQATVAGYKAVLMGVGAMPRLMPMLVTAAGTIPPATVLVIGAGVAGLMAIATARRLGANVRAFDIRPETRQEVESLGARFVAAEAVVAEARDAQGYAREVGEEARRRQAEALARHVAEADLVVTTAAVPGRQAPVIVTDDMVRNMKPGAVIVDLAAESGGNCALTMPGQDVVRHGVTIMGPLGVAASIPTHASQMYARNVLSVIQHVVKDGALALNPEDEIVKAMLVAGTGSRA
jgi:NAD(P) transhydrogenase subunit alpha